jgi:hypothetical protein
MDRRMILVAGEFRPPQNEEEKKGGRSMMFSKTMNRTGYILFPNHCQDFSSLSMTRRVLRLNGKEDIIHQTRQRETMP